MLLLSEGQMSDHKGAALLLDTLPRACELIGDRGYDSDGFRKVLLARRIKPCIPPRKNRRVQHPCCRTLYRQRHKVENMFGRDPSTGTGSPPAMTAAPIPTFRPSTGQIPSCSGSIVRP